MPRNEKSPCSIRLPGLSSWSPEGGATSEGLLARSLGPFGADLAMVVSAGAFHGHDQVGSLESNASSSPLDPFEAIHFQTGRQS